MHTLVTTGTPFVLAGSIRDDGPLPEVITDVMEAQRAMRAYAQRAGACLMLSTMLHSIATGNLLPAAVHTVCVDINPAVVTKLADRGSFQTIGMVTDVGLFVEQLADELEARAPADVAGVLARHGARRGAAASAAAEALAARAAPSRGTSRAARPC